MSASELMLLAVAAGLEDDGTTAAALDAIREESGCSLLSAVLEVSRVYAAQRNSHDLAEASKYLAPRSPIKKLLTEEILLNTLNVPDGAFVTINLVPGGGPPVAIDNSLDNGTSTLMLASVSVGALWVKRAANEIMVRRRAMLSKSRARRSR